MALVVNLPSTSFDPALSISADTYTLETIGFADYSNWHTNEKHALKQHIVKIPLQESNNLKTLLNDHNHGFGVYVKINGNAYGFLSLQGRTLWLLNTLKEQPDVLELNEDTKMCNVQTLSKILNNPSSSLLSYDFRKFKKQKVKKQVSMQKVPSISSENVLKTIDPMKFICDRYLTTLYSQSIPLEHFMKSSIPKMHLLRRDDIQLAKDCLTKLLIDSYENFESRHQFIENVNAWADIDNIKHLLIDEMESNYRLKRFKKLNSLSKEQIVEYLSNFKLRDLKLQILLCLELLKLMNKEGDVPPPQQQQQKIPEKTKQPSVNLIGRKKRKDKKRLIPTLLGTVIPTSIDFDVDFRLLPTNTHLDITPTHISKLIHSYFEKLCVWDAIMGLDYKDINSSWGFLSNCVIPFYEKHHKKLLSNLAIKSRGPAFLLKIRAREERKKREEKRKQKVVSSATIERKSTSIDLSSIKLNRSQSSFSMNNGNSKSSLARKTFSMVKSTSIIEPQSLPLSQPTSSNFSSDPTSYSDLLSSDSVHSSKKRKLYAPSQSSNNTLFHHNQVIEATPQKTRVIKLPVVSPLKEITSSPQIERIQIKPGVFEVGSSPMKQSDVLIEQTPQRSGKIIVSSSPYVSKLTESAKRKLNFN